MGPQVSSKAKITGITLLGKAEAQEEILEGNFGTAMKTLLLKVFQKELPHS